MREHPGLCPCGRKTYLFGQCPRCIREEHEQRSNEAVNTDLGQPDQEVLGEPSHRPVAGEPEKLEQDQLLEAAGPALPNILPMPNKQPGRNTVYVSFLTNGNLPTILAEYAPKLLTHP